MSIFGNKPRRWRLKERVYRKDIAPNDQSLKWRLRPKEAEIPPQTCD